MAGSSELLASQEELCSMELHFVTLGMCSLLVKEINHNILKTINRITRLSIAFSIVLHPCHWSVYRGTCNSGTHTNSRTITACIDMPCHAHHLTVSYKLHTQLRLKSLQRPGNVQYKVHNKF